jgi:hypothetical protein
MWSLTMTLFDDPFQQLAYSLHDQRGTYAVLLGSGISHAAGITTGWEITEDLIRRVVETSGAEPDGSWGAHCATRLSPGVFASRVGC